MSQMGMMPARLLDRAVDATRTTIASRQHIETQGRKAYGLYEWFNEHAKTGPDVTVEQWTIRHQAAQGTVQGFRPYDEFVYLPTGGTIKPSITTCLVRSHMAMQYDLYEVAKLKGSDQLYDRLKADESSNEEDRVDQFERLYLNAPTEVGSDDDRGVNGLKYHFPLSQTSGGVFVEQKQPARNGVYVTLGDGSIVSTTQGVDRATLANVRLRPPVATHDNEMNEALLRQIDEMADFVGYKFLPGLTGEQPSTRLGVIWSSEFDRAYARLIASLGAPGRSDYFPDTSGRTVASMKPMRCYLLDDDATQPVFLVDAANIHLRKTRGIWGDPITDTTKGPTIRAYPKMWGMQIKAIQPGQVGGVIHGSW